MEPRVLEMASGANSPVDRNNTSPLETIFQPMKTLYPPQILADQLEQLHCMETKIARSLPILAGSAMNVQLRKWLCSRAKRARDRRDLLQDLRNRHPHLLASKPYDGIRSILAEGNRDLALIHHPYSRDVAVIEHCIRIEQHAKTAYGIAVPLTHRIGFPQLSGELKFLLSDLEAARIPYQSLESEIFSIAASQSQTGTGICSVSASPSSANGRESREDAQLAVGY